MFKDVELSDTLLRAKHLFSCKERVKWEMSCLRTQKRKTT